MKVLATGAAGQVGCRLVRQLLARGHEVRGTILPDDPNRGRLDGLDVELVEGDLTDEAYVDRAVDGADAVVHTANLVGPHFTNNVRTTLMVARACRKRSDSIERYVYISSSSVYPNDSHQLACAYHPVDEMHPQRPLDEYGLSKRVGEDMSEMLARATGLRTVVLRPSRIQSGAAVLGSLSVGFVVAILRAGQRSPDCELYCAGGGDLADEIEAAAGDTSRPCSVRDEEGRPWLDQPADVRDVAHAAVCALESPGAVGEAFNVAAPTPYSFPEGAELLAERTGQEPLEVRLPVQWRYDLDPTKARGWIGYEPRGDLRTVVSSALTFREGQHEGYDW